MWVCLCMCWGECCEAPIRHGVSRWLSFHFSTHAHIPLRQRHILLSNTWQIWFILLVFDVCKIFHLDKVVVLYVSIGERGSTHQANSYLVNTVPVSLGWVMSSLDSPGWETGMLQRADWGKGLWAGCCVCVFFNMWNEETMEERLCSCLCMCTPVCLYGGFVATLLCEDLSLYRPAVSGGVCGLPVHSQQTHKAK